MDYAWLIDGANDNDKALLIYQEAAELTLIIEEYQMIDYQTWSDYKIFHFYKRYINCLEKAFEYASYEDFNNYLQKLIKTYENLNNYIDSHPKILAHQS